MTAHRSAARWAAALLVAVALPGGPARADGALGSGPLHLHPGVKEAYGAFKQTYNPTYFAVSTNGLAYGYLYCPDQACHVSDSRGEAIRACQSVQAYIEDELRKKGAAKALKGECFIYANASRVLWQGEITELTDADYWEWLASSGFLLK